MMKARSLYLFYWTNYHAALLNVGFTGKRTTAILVPSDIVFYMLKKYFIVKVHNIFVAICSFYSSVNFYN